jgi:hypothetical protein
MASFPQEATLLRLNSVDDIDQIAHTMHQAKARDRLVVLTASSQTTLTTCHAPVKVLRCTG